ncbi:MAG: hypothetical protein HYV19_04250 [Gemmatimonadetes bacterium]|nr:hypothetical protein [Gemmatimonadota bacterium]
MIARVARGYAQAPLAVARAPFAETAWAALQLATLERVDALTRDSEALHAATRNALAFHEPRKLEEERRALLQLVRPQVSASDAKARALRLVRSGAMNDLEGGTPA